MTYSNGAKLPPFKSVVLQPFVLFDYSICTMFSTAMHLLQSSGQTEEKSESRKRARVAKAWPAREPAVLPRASERVWTRQRTAVVPAVPELEDRFQESQMESQVSLCWSSLLKISSKEDEVSVISVWQLVAA